MKHIIVFAASFIWGAMQINALAAESDEGWDHNGSIVNLRVNGAVRKFYYLIPREGLPVKTGELLFDGRKDGSRYSGTAYVFSARCGPRGYPVTGHETDRGRTIRLNGQAPLFDASCNLAGSRPDELVFKHGGVVAPMIVGEIPSTARYCVTSAGRCELLMPGQPGASCWCPVSGNEVAHGRTR